MKVIELNFIVDHQFVGYRIDRYLFVQSSEYLYSRAMIERLVLQKKVFINHQTCLKKSQLLKYNDSILVIYEQGTTPNLLSPQKEDIKLDIQYEDDYLAMINKPAGMTVHPAPGNYSGTLVNALLAKFPQLSSCEVNRPGLVHRLDKDTSGLIIITKDNKTHAKMSQLFMNRQIQKTYLGWCLGVPKPLEQIINQPIHRHQTQRKKMTIAQDGRPALTSFKTVEDFRYFSLLEINIATGRTHQIRVHLENINHPIIGDSLYNSTKRTVANCPNNLQKRVKLFLEKKITRQLLHAWKLEFKHPMTNQQISIETEKPLDFVMITDFLKELFSPCKSE